MPVQVQGGVAVVLPSGSWTTFRSTPEATARDAAVWRGPWGSSPPDRIVATSSPATYEIAAVGLLLPGRRDLSFVTARSTRPTAGRPCTDARAWLASPCDARGPHLIPVSFWWDGSRVTTSAFTNSGTLTNVEVQPKVRASIGSTTDVLMIDAMVSVVPVVDTIPGVGAGSVSTTEHGRVATRQPTNEAVLELDAAQGELYEGPCITAIEESSESGVVVACDFAGERDDRRWPRFAPRAPDAGYRALLSTRITADGVGLRAVLNLYSVEANTFDDHTRTMASLFGAQAVPSGSPPASCRTDRADPCGVVHATWTRGSPCARLHEPIGPAPAVFTRRVCRRGVDETGVPRDRP